MSVVESPAVMSASELAERFATNNRVIGLQVAGLTHADGLIQPPVRGNCLNWIIGHILVHRDYILDALGAEKILDEKTVARYDRESEPILEDGEDVLPLETLLSLLEESSDRIAAALAASTEESLARNLPDGVQQTVGRSVAFLQWHETYHIGQTELLRQLAGANDKVI